MINDTEWKKFYKMFNTFKEGKLLKGYTYTAVNKNAKLAKQLFNSMQYNDGGSIDAFEEKGYLKSGFRKGAGYRLTNRAKYIDGNAELVSSTYNKRKFKGKSGFKYKGFKYADKFIYKRFNSPVDKFERKIRADYDKGIEIAIQQAMKKGGFS